MYKMMYIMYIMYIRCYIALSPVARLSLLLKYWPTATTAGTYMRPSPIPPNTP